LAESSIFIINLRYTSENINSEDLKRGNSAKLPKSENWKRLWLLEMLTKYGKDVNNVSKKAYLRFTSNW
jgi:hypothetical protein